MPYLVWSKNLNEGHSWPGIRSLLNQWWLLVCGPPGSTPDCMASARCKKRSNYRALHYDRPLMVTIPSKFDLHLRLPDDNSSSAFHPAAGGTGSLPCCWRKALPQ